MNTKKITVAVIGGGVNSAVGLSHILAMRISGRFDIIFGCFSRNRKISLDSGVEYSIPKENIFTNWKEMLVEKRHQIECVIILTPTDQHIEQVIFCFELGLPVICEKSLFCRSSEIRSLEKLGKETFLSVVFNYITYPMMQELREIVNSDKLGKINQIRVEMPQEGYIRKTKRNTNVPQKWRLTDQTVPNLLLDLGSHMFSMVRFITDDKPTETISVMNNFGSYSVIDDINCIIKYESGMICNFWMSKSSLGNKNSLKIKVYGTEGSAEWSHMEPELLKISDKFGTISILDRGSESSRISCQKKYNRFKPGHPTGFIESLANFYEDSFQDLIRWPKKRKTFGFEESKECILLLESISLSDSTKEWQKINTTE